MRLGASNLPKDFVDLYKRMERVERAVSRTPVVATSDTTPPVVSNIGVVPTASGATITWTTDELADTQVEYGTTTAMGTTTTLNTTKINSHSVNLTGLSASTTYFYRVRSKDAAGNLGTGPISNFTTGSVADTTPPVVSSRAVAPSGSSAIVTWTTDEPASSQVEYGATTSYGNMTTLDTSLLTSHSVSITGLAPSTTYNYRILTRDGAGNLTTTANGTFTTTSSSLYTTAFTGANGAAFPSEFTVTFPSGTSTTGGIADIQSNEGRLRTAAGAGYNQTFRALGTVSAKNVELLMKFRPGVNNQEMYFNVFLRAQTPIPTVWNQQPNGYQLALEPSWQQWYLHENIGGSSTNLASGSFGYVAGTTYWLRFQVNEGTIRFRIWAVGGTEPSTWFTEQTGRTGLLVAGRLFLQNTNGNDNAAAAVYFDDLTLTAL